MLVQLDAELTGLECHDFHHLVDCLPQIKFREKLPELASTELGVVKHVVDDIIQDLHGTILNAV